MKQDLTLSLLYPGDDIRVTWPGIGLVPAKITAFKVRSKGGIKALRKNPVNQRWNHPAHPIQIYYRTSRTGKRWISYNDIKPPTTRYGANNSYIIG